MAPLRPSIRERLDSRKEQNVASEAVRVWLLGGFRISVGSREIGEREWPLRKAASLAKLLALSPGHRLHREVVMDGVWLVELAPLSEGALVPQAVVATLGVSEQPGRPFTHTIVSTISLCDGPGHTDEQRHAGQQEDQVTGASDVNVEHRWQDVDSGSIGYAGEGYSVRGYDHRRNRRRKGPGGQPARR